MKKIILLIVFAIGMMNANSATTYTWTGASGGTWGTTTNWNPNGTPIAGDSVVINTASAMSIALGGVQVVKGITFMGGGTITFTATATQTFTATHIKVDGSPVIFSADQVSIISSLTFNGGSSKITHTPVTAGKAFILGNGNAFILSGNTETNCLDGNGQYNFFTTNSLTAYFNPTNVYYQLILQRGIITLGTNLQVARFSTGTTSTGSPTNNLGLVLNGKTLTLSATGAGSCTLTNTSTVNQGIDASVTGSKVVISTTQATFLNNITGRIFKDATTIDNLEMNSSGNTFISGYPLTVKNLILTAGTINNSTNNITLTNGGTIIRSNQAALLTSAPIYGSSSTDRVNVNYTTTLTTANELLGTTGAIGTLSINDGVTATLSNSGVSMITLGGTLTGYSNPSVSISSPSSGGITATATLKFTGNSPNRIITGINITNPGSGYDTTPTVTITDATGTGWTATPILFSQNPTSCDNITIGQGNTAALTYPNSTNVVTLNVNNDIIINSGASFLCGTQANTVTHLLNVGGSITNSGTFTPVTTAGTKVVDLTLNGTSANQNLCAATFNNLTIANTSGLNPAITLTGDITVNNTLTVGNESSGSINFAGVQKITTSQMTINNWQANFVSGVQINSNLTFIGANSRLILNSSSGGTNLWLGNGNDFTLNGNSVTNYIDGNSNLQFNFNIANLLGTSSAFYFNPATTYYNLLIQNGIIPLGTDVKINRIAWGSSVSNTMKLALNGKILTISGSGTSVTTNTSSTIGIDASVTGSKVLITSTAASILNASGRILYPATTIDNLEFNSSGNTFYPSYPLTVNNLILTAGTINSSNNIVIAPEGKLTLSTGTLITNNGITLQSTALGTATMLNSGTFSGTINAEQYLGSARNWYVSSPVQVTNSPANNITRYYEYVETGDNADLGVTGSTAYWKGLSTGTAMTVGKGYITQASAETTVQFSGTPNNGNITTDFNLTRNDAYGKGFNLVGNPYPSYIDWSLVAQANTNLMSTAWFKTKKTDVAGGGYTFASVNVTTPSSPEIVANNANTTITKYIPPMQAFWVRVKSGIPSTSITFTNAMREHRLDNGDLMKAPKVNERSRLRLQLVNGIESDETLIYFDNKATNDFNEYDSPKMMNNSSATPDLYTKSGAERLVINGLSQVSDNLELSLGFSLNAAASLKLKATEMSNFPIGTRIYLLDKVETSQVELLPETEYSFKTTAVTVNNESRFSLLFKAPGNTTGIENTEKSITQIFVNAANQIAIIAPEKCNYAVYNALGLSISSGVTTANGSEANIPIYLGSKLQTGMYVVKLSVNGQSEIQKVIIR